MEEFALSQENERGRIETAQIGACMDRISAMVREQGRKKGAVVKLYLSNFRTYNDSFGYAFGGTLINEISTYLRSIEGVTTYHIRGVEFILVSELQVRRDITSILDSIMRRFDDTWQIGNIVCACSVHAGVVHLPGEAETASEVLELLGLAVNESALLGKNQLVEFNDDLKLKYLRRHQIALEIPRAIEADLIELHFRPTFQVSKERFTRVDSYAQMFCEGIGLVREPELVSIAENSGQINALKRYVLTRTCGLIAEMIAAGIDFETVAIKASPIQFLQERFVPDLAAVIKAAGIPAHCLAFEVEENMANSTFPRIYACMTELSEMGVELILSDFGSGSLGLYNILSMSINAVKIKKSLVWMIDNDPNGASFVDGLINLSKGFELKLVAEGVETQAQVDKLNEFGCDYQQGNYFSGFLTSKKLIEKLKNGK